jgi:hypothetical protein
MKESFVAIAVGDTETVLEYVVDGNSIVSHSHPVGYRHIEADGMNAIARSKFLDGLLYVLEFISLHDRIPTEFKVSSPRYSIWIGETLEKYPYTQFYTKGLPISVTLEDTLDVPRSYARHSKTLQSFKI